MVRRRHIAEPNDEGMRAGQALRDRDLHDGPTVAAAGGGMGDWNYTVVARVRPRSHSDGCDKPVRRGGVCAVCGHQQSWCQRPVRRGMGADARAGRGIDRTVWRRGERSVTTGYLQHARDWAITLEASDGGRRETD
jgi:hypothetical protein